MRRKPTKSKNRIQRRSTAGAKPSPQMPVRGRPNAHRRDAASNPYAPGAGTKPPFLAGREREMEQFALLLSRLQTGRHERSLLVTGLRGVGKTVLLNRFEEMAEAASWRSAFQEIRTTSSLPNHITQMARKILLSMSRIERMKERATFVLRVLKAFQVSVANVDLRIDVDAIEGIADSGSLTEDLTDLLAQLGEAARDLEIGVLFLFDEVQLLKTEEFESLLAALHRVAQRGLPVAVVGAGLSQVPGLAGEAKSYAERLFRFPHLGPLDEDSAKAALIIPAAELHVVFAEDALTAILERTSRYPYFIQLLGKQVWDAGTGSVVSLSEVETALPPFQDELDGSFFRVRIQRATEGERRYLAALASLGDGPARSGRVAETLGRTTVDASAIRDSLIKKGLIYGPTHGYTDFTVPLFADYVRRTQAALR